MRTFQKRLQKFSNTGFQNIESARYWIIVAERIGFPPVQKQSIAHAMENMWLAAASKGIGFCLVSAVSTLSKNKDFLKLIGINPGEYEIDGCLAGYPVNEKTRKRDLNLSDYITWID